MIQNPATMKMLLGLHGGSEAATATVKGRPPELVAREKICREGERPDGALGFKTDCLFAAIVAAGCFVKRDARRAYASAKASVLGGLLSFDRDFLAFDQTSLKKEGTVDNAGWIVDIRRGRIPNIGTAVCIIRPMFQTWATEFSITFDPQRISRDKVFKLVELAGDDIGLGDFRVACKGRYGTFDVVDTKLEVVPASDTGRVTFADVQDEWDKLVKDSESAQAVVSADDEELPVDDGEPENDDDGNEEESV